MAEETKIVPDFEQPLLELEQKINQLSQSDSDRTSAEINQLKKQYQQLKKQIYSNLTNWQRIQLSRHPQRPYTLDYLAHIFNDYQLLSGDRCFGIDGAIVGGLAMLENQTVIFVGHQKGRTLEENLKRNFGSAQPEGYRFSRRMFLLARQFKFPLITFIDTPGAFPGIEAEQRGQATAIAENILLMSELPVPIISVVIGEGGSGGALGIGVADRLLLLENSYYSVISPEGCAAILFRDAAKAKEAAEALKITARDIYQLDCADEIISEPLGGAQADIGETARNIKEAIQRHLRELTALSVKQLLNQRYKKYQIIGENGGKNVRKKH